MRKIIYGVLIAFVVVAGVVLIDRSVRINRTLPQTFNEGGKTLPADVKLKVVGKDETFTLDKYKGKVVLINFWATWCSACVAEMPSMVKLYEAMNKEGFEIIAVNVDDNPEKAVPEFAKKMKINFPIVYEVDKEKKFENFFGVVAIPFSGMLSKNQAVLWAESGERDWMSEVVISEIKKRLKE